ncbi:hypothetical protein V1525DRAFT_407725, partial [Lipomyces kononenkoae]
MNKVLFSRLIEQLNKPTIRTTLLVLLAISTLAPGLSWTFRYKVSEYVAVAVVIVCTVNAATGRAAHCIVLAAFSIIASMAVSVSNEPGSPVKRDSIYVAYKVSDKVALAVTVGCWIVNAATGLAAPCIVAAAFYLIVVSISVLVSNEPGSL